MRNEYYQTHISVFLLVFSINTYAAHDYTGKIKYVTFNHGVVIISLHEGGGGSTCGTGDRFWFDPTLEKDKAAISLAIAARTTDTTVYVAGYAECKPEWPYSNAQKVQTLRY